MASHPATMSNAAPSAGANGQAGAKYDDRSAPQGTVTLTNPNLKVSDATESPAGQERRRKAHRRMMEAQNFENDLSNMDEMNHLLKQRDKIANLLQDMKEKVSEVEEGK